MHIRLVVVLPLALLLSGCAFLPAGLLPSEAAPAPAPQLSPGDRIRVFLPAAREFRQTARLVSLSTDSIVLARTAGDVAGPALSSGRGRWAIPLGAVGRLEVSRGVQRNTEFGAILGAAAGLVAAVAWNAAATSCHDLDCLGWGMRIVAGGAALGAGVGFFSKTERWEEVPPDELHRLRVGVTPLPAVRLGLGQGLAEPAQPLGRCVELAADADMLEADALAAAHAAGESKWGLHDLAGNVWELTSSDHDAGN